MMEDTLFKPITRKITVKEMVLEIRTTNQGFYERFWEFMRTDKDGVGTTIRIVDENPEQTLVEAQKLIDDTMGIIHREDYVYCPFCAELNCDGNC